MWNRETKTVIESDVVNFRFYVIKSVLIGFFLRVDNFVVQPFRFLIIDYYFPFHLFCLQPFWCCISHENLCTPMMRQPYYSTCSPVWCISFL